MQETELIKQCIKGNSTAQYALYSEHAPLMMGLCYRYTKSVADAEDILQEGFIKVFTRLHQFRGQGELGAWIRRIMVNTALTYLHKHNRYKRELQLDDIPLHTVTDENPDIYIDAKDLAAIIRELPVAYQTIFNLVAADGYSLVEVARMMNANENTIRSNYSRARKLLIGMLKENAAKTEKQNYAGRI